jgi:hypothetical protein
MLKFLLWLILLVLCWPLALLALLLYPLVWLLLLPFRLLGITVDAVFKLLSAILHLPARLLRGPSAVKGGQRSADAPTP